MKKPAPKILILYYSSHGSVQNMAQRIAYGIEKANCEAVLRTVPSLTNGNDTQADDAYVTSEELRECDAIALGSPARFGNMAAPMKHFWESTSTAWLNGELIDKPASVFTSSVSMHGGNETTLLTMMLPLLHHGMLIQGLPYSEPSLNATTTGGTPYGASHVAGPSNTSQLSTDEDNLCVALGYRLAQTTKKLNH
ncbi:MAG: NAD(P)H dehydrogenase (quinone) [Alteromonadaceae bacterium]|jgi:NAD(P)H dehydrogenase (quinone)